MITIPTSTTDIISSNVSGQLLDNGFLAVLLVAISIPLVFYVAHGLKGLVLLNRAKKARADMEATNLTYYRQIKNSEL